MRIANPSIRYFVRLLVGVLFIVSAFGKLMDVENFGNLIVSYGFFWSALLAPVIVIAEMGVGIALVLDMYPRVVSWVGIGILRLFQGIQPLFLYFLKKASPPQYTTCGGYSTGAAGSSAKRLSSRPTVACPVFCMMIML